MKKAGWISGAVAYGMLFGFLPMAHAQVDCDKEPSGALQRAIDAARPGDTILVSGTCEENVSFSESRNRITLDGGGKAVIDGPDPDQFTISVRGRGIVIRGFTITGGLDGVRIQQGGHAKIDGNTVERTRQFGIIVTEQSSAIIINNTVQHCARIGIVINAGSFAHVGVDEIVMSDPVTIGPNTVRYNTAGIFLERTASARIALNDISFNDSYGLRVDSSAQANISSNTIDGNAGDGVWISRGSGGQLGQPTGTGVLMLPNRTTIPNQGYGVRCEIGGYLNGRLGTLNGKSGAQTDSVGCINTLTAE